jgi:hypothetical protein
MLLPCMLLRVCFIFLVHSVDRCKWTRISRSGVSRDTKIPFILFRLHLRESCTAIISVELAESLVAVSPESLPLSGQAGRVVDKVLRWL